MQSIYSYSNHQPFPVEVIQQYWKVSAKGRDSDLKTCFTTYTVDYQSASHSVESVCNNGLRSKRFYSSSI